MCTVLKNALIGWISPHSIEEIPKGFLPICLIGNPTMLSNYILNMYELHNQHCVSLRCSNQACLNPTLGRRHHDVTRVLLEAWETWEITSSQVATALTLRSTDWNTRICWSMFKYLKTPTKRNVHIFNVWKCAEMCVYIGVCWHVLKCQPKECRWWLCWYVLKYVDIPTIQTVLQMVHEELAFLTLQWGEVVVALQVITLYRAPKRIVFVPFTSIPDVDIKYQNYHDMHVT